MQEKEAEIGKGPWKELASILKNLPGNIARGAINASGLGIVGKLLGL
jgi:hypothetical protein